MAWFIGIEAYKYLRHHGMGSNPDDNDVPDTPPPEKKPAVVEWFYKGWDDPFDLSFDNKYLLIAGTVGTIVLIKTIKNKS